MWKILLVSILTLMIYANTGETVKKVADPPVPEPQITSPKHTEKPLNVLPKHEHKKSCKETAAEPLRIICILDRSGSMASLASDTIGGYNSFLAKQKEKGAAEVTTVLFDDKYQLIADGVNINEIEELTPAVYFARGTTALLDAVGKTVTSTLSKMEEQNICPERRRVLVMIMTDGLENASQEFSKGVVKSLIEETTEKYHWNYIFMGANIDSVKEASALGIAGNRAINYSADKKGVRRTFDKMSEAADEMRESGKVSDDWKN